MEPLGWLNNNGAMSKNSVYYTSQGHSYSMPYYGDSAMAYNIVFPVPVIPPGGAGCLLAFMGVR